MALVVEDGTGRADAESYVSVADAETYATARGLTFATGSTAAKEQALRRATTWLDARYRSRFVGIRKNRRLQALEWPRTGSFDAMEPINAIGTSEIPTEVVKATVEAAVRELATPGYLAPYITPGKIKKSVRVGEIMVDYAVGTGSAIEQRPDMEIIENIMSTLLAEQLAPLTGGAVRA